MSELPKALGYTKNMITLLIGENAFELERTLKRIIADFDGVAEKVDGSRLELRQLPDLLMGVSLFADKRLVVIKDLSESKDVWAELTNWLGRVSDDINLVLVETKPDRRTTTYKELKKIANVVEFNPWGESDISKAEAWVVDEAKKIDIELDKKSAQLIVRRAGLNQWQLYNAVEKVSLLENITDEAIESVIEANSAENVFNLFDAALRGDRQRLAGMLATIEQAEDPFRLFALLSSQAFQLAAVVAAGPSDDTAKDFGVHPYVVSKLSSNAKKLGRGGARKIINIFARADDDMKLSRADPWLLIERTLQQVASL